jgi:hypothetical protein
MSTSVTVDQQESMLHDGRGTVAWSVGGERRTATLRVVRRDSAEPSRPSDLPAFAPLPALFGTPGEQPTRITGRRGKRSSARTRTHSSRQAA